MIALLGALVAVAGGLIAVFASLSATRKRGSTVVDNGAQPVRSDVPDPGSDGGGGGD